MPLVGRPYHHDDELQLISVSGQVSEFENHLGRRYRCIKEDGMTQWFTLRTNQQMKRPTRAEVKIGCKKLQLAFATFVDRLMALVRSEFSPKAAASPVCFRAELTSAHGAVKSCSS
jgi:hypothetical protein